MPISEQDRELLLTRPVEEDTRILRKSIVEAGSVPVLVESWSADGVRGSTAILLTRDAAGLDDDALKTLLIEQAGIGLGERVTIARRETHTFVNYNFEVK